MGDRKCGTGLWAGTLVLWGMLSLVVPKPWAQPYPPKPNEELRLKEPFRCAPAIYNPLGQGVGKTKG